MKKLFPIGLCIPFFLLTVVFAAAAMENNLSTEADEIPNDAIACSSCSELSCPLPPATLAENRKGVPHPGLSGSQSPYPQEKAYPRAEAQPQRFNQPQINDIDPLLTVRYTLWNSWGVMGILGYNRLVNEVFLYSSWENEDYGERVFGGIMVIYRF